jgi:predicted nucleic acid-binding protein
MKAIVVDSSVVIKWFVTEILSDEAQRILQGYRDGQLDLLAPDLLNAEIGSIVWKKKRLQNLTEADALLVISLFRDLSITFTSMASLLLDAYLLAATHQRTVYDMMYVALSITENCDFVTADEKLYNAVSRTLPNMIWLGNLPNDLLFQPPQTNSP